MATTKVFRGIIDRVLRARFYLSIALAALFIFSGYQLTKVKLDNAISIWFVDNDPTYKSYVDFQERYGSDEIIVASIPIDFNDFSSIKEPLKALQDRLENKISIERTFSLLDATYPLLVGETFVETKLYDPARSGLAQLKLFGQLADLSSQLITSDQKNTFLYIQLRPSSAIEQQRSVTIAEVLAEIKGSFPEALISGPPVLNESYNEGLFFEATLFGGLSFLVIVLLLLRLLPRRKFLGIALVAIILPTVYLFGFIGFLGIPLNMVSALIPTLLLVYALSDTVHILNALDRAIASNPSVTHSELLYRAFRSSLVPCGLTTLTTLAGYIALYFSDLPALKAMGLFASLGILFAFVIAYLVVIIGFSFFKLSELHSTADKPVKNQNSFAAVTRVILAVSHLSKLRVSALTIVALALSLLVATWVTVDTDSADLLSEGAIKKELITLEQQLGGSFRLQLDLKSTANGSILNEANIERLTEFTYRLRQHKQIASVLSIETFIRFARERYPQLRFRSADFLEKDLRFIRELESQQSFFSFIDLDRNVLSVTLSFPQLSSADISALLADINREFEAVFEGAEVEMKINGFATVFAKLNQFVVESQLYSFAFALLGIGLFLIAYLRSFKRAIVIIIPNLIPIFAVLAFMATFDIPLGVTTAMIAPIVLGIAMDDSLHLLYHFRKSITSGYSVSEALNHAVSYTTTALVVSSVSLSAGFMIITFSATPAVADFGLLCVFAVLVALIADLLLLPALIRRFW